MKVKIIRVERDRDAMMNRMHLVMEAVYDARDEAEARSAQNAMIYLGDSDCPVDVHITAMELVPFMQRDDLIALQREIQAELDERDRVANALVFPEAT